MISPTQQYSSLIASLRKAKLVTRGINKLGCTSDLQHLKLQAYILLCHAALEQYIEDVALAAALAARKKYTDDGIITKTLVALISSKLVDDISEKGKLKVTADLSSNIEEFSKEAFNRYQNVVKSNHGIIDRDQKNVLIPIGVDPTVVDVVLMNNLHTFGSRRGDVAHKFKVQRAETLTAVDTDLNTIVTNILGYDQAVCDALRLQMRQ